MITRVSLLLLCLCLILPLHAEAQAPSGGWQIPQIECGENCAQRHYVDEAGNLYVYVERTQPSPQVILYVIKRNASRMVGYDLLHIYSGRGVYRDFVPFANGKLVIFDVMADIPLVLFDPLTQKTIPLSEGLPGSVEMCNDASFFIRSIPGIYRIGKDRTLFCSNYQGTNHINLAHLENDTLIIDHVFDMGPNLGAERGVNPWIDIASTLDGKIYILAREDAPIIDQVAPQYAHLSFWPDYLVLIYDPGTETWKTTIIQNSSERWVGIEVTSFFAPFVGVDETGNLYFWHDSRTRDGVRTSELAKYNPQGKKVWQITEADFGGQLFYRPLLIGEDKFILDFDKDGLRYFEKKEDAAL